jgi:hypothetical protein
METNDAEVAEKLKRWLDNFARQHEPYLKKWMIRMREAEIPPFDTVAGYAAWALPSDVRQKKFSLDELDLYISAKVCDAQLSRRQQITKVAESAGGDTHARADAKASHSPEGHFSSAELATKYAVDAEAARKALDRWRRKHAGGDGYTENPDRRPNEPQFLYSLKAVVSVMEGLKSRTSLRNIRRTKSSGQRPAR